MKTKFILNTNTQCSFQSLEGNSLGRPVAAWCAACNQVQLSKGQRLFMLRPSILSKCTDMKAAQTS